jgi:hypothetical protein
MSQLTTIVTAAPVVLAATVLPGAAWVLAAGSASRSRAETVGTSIALSPGLFGGAVALLLACGVPLRVAALGALGGFAVLAGVAAWAHRPRGRSARAASAPDARVTWAVALAVPALVALLPLCREWWRIYSDAWNHFAITRAVVEHGAHPVDPFFAGLPLQYPWIYHAHTAGVEALTGAGAFGLMASWSAFALAGVLLCAGPAISRLHGRAPGVGLALLLFGLNAAFVCFAPLLLVRALIGTVRGWPEITRIFGMSPFGVMRITILLQGLSGQDFFLNKFMVATPFALGLAAFTALAGSFVRWLESGDRRELWLAAGATLAGGLMHPVIALDLVPTTMGLAVVAMLAPRWAGISRSAAAAWAGAVAAGALPVALYTSRIMGGVGGSHHELPIDVSMWKFLGLYSTLALGLVLALRPALGLFRAGGPWRAWVIWLVLQLGIANVIRLPGSSSFFTIDKFAYFVWIPLAITCAAELEQRLARFSRAARLAILVGIFLPVNGFALAGRVWDPLSSARQPWDMPGLVWMRANLPANSVLIVPYGDPVTGNYVGRDQYIMDEPLGLQLGYPAREIGERRELVERFFASDSLTAGEAGRLRSLGRPVYAVWTRFADSRLAVTPRTIRLSLLGVTPTARRPRWEGRYPVVYASESHVVAELLPGPRAAAPAGSTHPVVAPRR